MTVPGSRPEGDLGPGSVLVVDAANVIGSRPDGWWRDRAGAVRTLRDRLAAWPDHPEVVLVTEGAARSVEGVAGVEVVAATGSGDDTIVDVVAARSGGFRPVVVVTADRELRRRVQAYGASTVGPGTLRDILDAEER